MTIFTQLAKSMYSPKDIASTRYQGIGKTILYVFLLTLISILPVGYYISSGITEAFDTAKKSVKDDLPSFTIEQGSLISDTNAPLTITKDEFTIIFDPSGAVEEKDMAGMDATIAMLQNTAVLATGGQTNAIPYSVFAGEKMTKQDVLNLIDAADSSLPVMIGLVLLVIFVFSSGMKFIEISLLALFGLLLKNLAGKPLQYRHLWRIAAYSVTLTTIFFTIMGFLKTPVPYNYGINWFVSSMILLLAIKEVPSPHKKEG
ncbi:DUF1189 domain-containing protein [Mesobacillus subterraneus]|uniref:DUF1189 domain-containing protein n=1 Tax=Mesobacillus subterraneus TaxID=285983 RepID=A0A3R9F0X5_9BACI|nr:DUF1189 domain-containing protein [Mesobacillus subterraneus]RSD27462.1 DUF1189 domain-containing protein [Mesobacillus subterraneus]